MTFGSRCLICTSGSTSLDGSGTSRGRRTASTLIFSMVSITIASAIVSAISTTSSVTVGGSSSTGGGGRTSSEIINSPSSTLDDDEEELEIVRLNRGGFSGTAGGSSSSITATYMMGASVSLGMS